MRCHWVFAGLLLLAGCGRKTEVPQASRAPEKGCQWIDFRNDKQGYSVLVQDCDGGRSGTEQARKDIEMFTKGSDVPIEVAIRERIFGTMTDREREGCAVRPQTRIMFPGLVQSFEIVPRGPYASEVLKRREEGEELDPCGKYGPGRKAAFFEYQPSESLKKYVFVRLGQDPPLFDEMSIRIAP
jgi:hypothetical protein